MAAILRTVHGDIVSLKVDAVVNAANSTLLGGGGVDGAIHDAAGPELFVACQSLAGCDVGDAKTTAGYRMKATYVIHAVGRSGGVVYEASLNSSPPAIDGRLNSLQGIGHRRGLARPSPTGCGRTA
jgi:O-acetyl-ADP-ribose deacetylase (regulator of RNase III)